MDLRLYVLRHRPRFFPRETSYNQAMRVTVGVSGGIAAYKAAELVRVLQRQAIEVHVVMTEAAGKLQQAGVIRYRRGHITVLDRSGLESQVCECYGVVKKEFARLLPEVTGRPDIFLQSHNTQRDAVVRTTERAGGRK